MVQDGDGDAGVGTIVTDPDKQAGGQQQQEPAPAPAPTPQDTPPPPSDWKAQMPVDIKHDSAFEGMKGYNDVARAYVELKKATVGKVDVPTDKSTQEEIEAFHQKMGKPKEASGYELPEPKDLPAGTEFSEDFLERFKQISHIANLTQEQASRLFNWYHADVIGQIENVNKAKEQAKSAGYAELQAEWGVNWQANVEIMNRAIEQFGGSDMVQWVIDNGIGNDAFFMRFMHTIGTRLVEAGNLVGEPAGGAIEEHPTDLTYKKMPQPK